MFPTFLYNDVFRWTLVASTIFHLVVVLGISFVMPEQAENPVFRPPLKITLVSDASEFQPLETDIVAQANSLGENEDSSEIPVVQRQGAEQSSNEQDLYRESDQFMADTSSDSSRSNSEPFESAEITREILKQDIDLAYLNAQSRPREVYVSSRARENRFAAYIEQWRLLVERVGNLNYPEAAKQQKLEGSLVLDAEILPSGKIGKVRVLQSSGHKVLDDAAVRIVHIAAPFDRFPESFASDVDSLHIVRTWEFGSETIISRNIGTF